MQATPAQIKDNQLERIDRVVKNDTKIVGLLTVWIDKRYLVHPLANVLP
jgi:hypothetical protein